MYKGMGVWLWQESLSTGPGPKVLHKEAALQKSLDLERLFLKALQVLLMWIPFFQLAFEKRRQTQRQGRAFNFVELLFGTGFNLGFGGV
jgi:hypothetical protein